MTYEVKVKDKEKRMKKIMIIVFLRNNFNSVQKRNNFN